MRHHNAHVDATASWLALKVSEAEKSGQSRKAETLRDVYWACEDAIGRDLNDLPPPSSLVDASNYSMLCLQDIERDDLWMAATWAATARALVGICSLHASQRERALEWLRALQRRASAARSLDLAAQADLVLLHKQVGRLLGQPTPAAALGFLEDGTLHAQHMETAHTVKRWWGE